MPATLAIAAYQPVHAGIQAAERGLNATSRNRRTWSTTYHSPRAPLHQWALVLEFDGVLGNLFARSGLGGK
jgi:hypothetical protein